MNLNFSAWSIRNPIPALVLFFVLGALGIVTFRSMAVTRFPNIDVPVIAISVTQSGAAPSELETQVARRVEDAVASVAGVKHIQSTLTDGLSQTVIEFRLEVDTDRALNDVKDAIAKIRADLPRTVDEPVIQRIDVEGQAILTYAATAPAMTLEALSWHVDDVIKRELQSLKGVGRVERYGGLTREIRVALDPDRLMALGITAADVNQQLRMTNADLAGGRGEIGGQEQSIRTLGGARDVDDLAAMTITIPGGRKVRLDEIAKVSDAAEEPRSFSRLDGKPVVSFAVFRAKGASDVDVKRVVEARLVELRKADPGVAIQLIDESVAYTFGNYLAAMETLIEGALLAVLVVFIFLRDWRATLIAAVALPLSIIPTFWMMEMMGFSLNLVSLLAMTLATGILVDDAIVEIENIVRHMRMGKSAYRASIEAADEIGLAVIAITFTIIAVFAPVSFMGGIAGQYFKQFGLTVAIAVFFSLLVARLVTPMMAAYLMRSAGHETVHRDGLVMRAYAGFLEMTLKPRLPWYWLSVVGYVGILAFSVFLAGHLPSGFIPNEDASRVVLSVELPPGSTLDDTARATDDMGARLARMPEVRSVFVLGGAKPTGAAEVRNAVVIANLVPKTERADSQKVIEGRITELLAALPDIRAYFVNDRGERQLSVSVLGNDPAALDKGVAMIESAMRRLPGFSNVAASAGLDRPEIRIRPKFEEMARLGVSTEQISEAVRVATIGDVGANLAKFNAGDRLVPIRVELREGARGNLGLIETLMIRTASGDAVPLSTLADIGFDQGPSSIERYDRVRRVVLGADLAKGIELGEGLERVKSLPEAKALPEGVRFQEAGDAEIMGEVFQGFAMAMGAGVMMVLGLLVLLLGSIFLPLTIIFSLPLSLVGVFAALLVTNNAVSMPVVIGILMLMGIVTKNAILLIDFAVERVRHGLSRKEAIIDAGRKRARPIVMTSIAMGAGMLPTALGVGEGGEFRAPMAIAVIGGLVASTILSLLFVPYLYLCFDDVNRLFGWIFGRFIGSSDEPDEAAGKGAADSGGHGGASAHPAE